LPQRGLLDRIVRGQTWIALLGLMLVGIVAMQVEVLKLGAGEGRALQQSAALQSRNEILRASVASESSEQRIEQLAASRYGMVMPDPTSVVFLSSNTAANAARATRTITAPDATGFLASLQAADPVAPAPTTTTPTDTSSALGTTPAVAGTDTTPTTPTTVTPTTVTPTTVTPTTQTTPATPVVPAVPATGPSDTTAPSTTGGAAVTGG
jgi:cell division protein FtsL